MLYPSSTLPLAPVCGYWIHTLCPPPDFVHSGVREKKVSDYCHSAQVSDRRANSYLNDRLRIGRLCGLSRLCVSGERLTYGRSRSRLSRPAPLAKSARRPASTGTQSFSIHPPICRRDDGLIRRPVDVVGKPPDRHRRAH